MTENLAIQVTDLSLVAEARRQAMALARTAGFDESGAGKVALVVTEAATNLLKHAQGGEVLLCLVQRDADPGAYGMEVLALDKGPGMADVAASLRDGYSTAGSPGTGLGAITRLADWYDIYSVPQAGTVLAARLWARSSTRGRTSPAAAPAAPLQLGCVNVPKPGETVCGDAWAVRGVPQGAQVLMADGLGHGPLAAAAAQEAVRLFLAAPPTRSPGAILEAQHTALRSTRGAAVAVAHLDLVLRQVIFAGIGNISGVVVGPQGNRNMVSQSGTLGHTMHRITEFVYPYDRDSLLVLYTDGLSSHARLDGYAGLTWRDPLLIAGVLYRDFARRRDDATVFAAREAPVGEAA